jgi:hypothetical protein
MVGVILEHLRRRHHRVVVEKRRFSVVPLIVSARESRGRIDGIADPAVSVLPPILNDVEPRGLAVPHAQLPNEPRALLGLVRIEEGLEQVARALGRDVKDALMRSIPSA